MATDEFSELTVQNQVSYENLLVSIEASEGMLSLLIGVCDDSHFRDDIIQRYERELQPEIRPYRVTLARGEPSLKAAIAGLVENDQYLRQSGRGVITVTGAETLFFLKLGAPRSEQEIFFGYLQWTREGMREFPFPIILWITHQMERHLSRQAPDFWSWRKGVFRFKSQKRAAIHSREVKPIQFIFEDREFSEADDDEPYFLPIEDLQALIRQIEEKQGIKDPNLATLYARMEQIYRRRLERGEAQDYKQEQALAIEYCHKAAELQKELGLDEDYATSLNNLAFLYRAQGRYGEAEPLYQQALEMRKRLLGDEHPDVATSLNNLAKLYYSQGRYGEAEPLYQQALEMKKRLLGAEHPDVAQSLNDLAGLYYSQGRYGEAEPLWQQALEMRKRLLGEAHPDVASSLNNLAGLYESRGRYSEAEPLFQQALEMKKRLLGDQHPDVAQSLNNLALLYDSQGRYGEAEPLYQQALEMRKRLLGDQHPDVAQSLNNLAALYDSQGRYSEAEPLYLEALEIAELSLGVSHPNTVIFRENLQRLRDNHTKSGLLGIFSKIRQILSNPLRN